ncbi:Dihydrofolate synthase / Folylpolyglutamate synthase [Thioalkalivibrio nitratireducens DSM 14787]|uniref:Dihydrofolate synthase/folylpolyglutamate synthase n=1 Tax=Thioalkalivibrio nitratireducens (strain DSM 14787 / UNIQEM 213 / ALEN2) TaxID=1255043 RepID=L0DV71_THIND|nr:folylpolyglutamate synthase/dihydrofolate synthase family protein [Thioalkalivibrio nitratireducens]AGA32897.1 Dihydrofolate synthase / Folylpolyglutamate synthase [Thioalkalivibrio nitratireducens DSM 14787]
MRFPTLTDWLAWQETLHPKAIDPGLERLTGVADALRLRSGSVPKTITVAGTNGKGTVATVLAALLRSMGFRVGLYTSPHLLHYNERVNIDGRSATDAELCRAFDIIDSARGPVSLSYFEFGTLAAALLFREAPVDFQILEVGLGGRLDAVNLWDPDVAVITGVDLDHEAWLGSDRESIGREKAGILRPCRPVVLGETDPPRSVLDTARELHATVYRQGADFGLDAAAPGCRWTWLGSGRSLGLGITPGLAGARQRNVATALAALHVLGLQDRLTLESLGTGMAAVPPGRLQRIAGRPEWLLDVAHNGQAARELAAFLQDHPVPGSTVAIVALMADKRRRVIFEAMGSRAGVWIPIRIPGERALDPGILAEELRTLPGAEVVHADTVADAVRAARKCAGPDGRVVVFGSFLTVQAVTECLAIEAPGADTGT